ncbi:hypothetical protein Lalb_Chr13g0292621 [Lupinus albus]|uniref:Uncharacterized protein n=1 Tax=Lupinus albus TaxID=3870 RepID=A0A6A4PHN6_LUPAL|nr:hypothetical protein Lalb_Chr13g0292621 [Lupinus albus]
MILFGQIPNDKLLSSFHYSIDDSDDIDDINCDPDTELDLLTMMNALTMDTIPEIDRFYIPL